MNAKLQFYSEKRADKGVRRDVKDVIGELNILAKKSIINNQLDATKLSATKDGAAEKRTPADSGTTSTRFNLRSSAPKRSNNNVSYIEESSDDEISEQEDITTPPKKKNKPSKMAASVIDSPTIENTIFSQNMDFASATYKREEVAYQKSIESSLAEQTLKTQKLEKKLEETHEMLALFIKNQTNMEMKKKKKKDKKRQDTVATKSTFLNRAEDTTSGMTMMLPQSIVDNRSWISNNIGMTSREFFLYNSLQERQSIDRLRQCERDTAERFALFQVMSQRT